MKRTLTVVLLLLLTACATTQTPSNNNQPGQPPAASQPTANQPNQPSAAAKPLGALQEGEASGTILVEGQTINLKYAYAASGEMFDEPAVRFLLTETPVSQDVLTKFFETSYAQFPDGNRGLEYKVGKGFWVQYNPGGFQTSGINTLKDYSVENSVVRERDEDTDKFDNKEYKRAVSFVARIVEKKK